MSGLTLKQHNPLRERKALTLRARGGHLCLAKEAIIKGQSDYLCISADPLCPSSTFSFFISHLNLVSNVENNFTGLEHINKKEPSLIC